MAGKRIVKLRSATGEIFEVDEAVASQSEFLRNVMEDVGVESLIPLPNVSSDILGQVLDYCKRCVGNDAKFVKLDLDNLHSLIMAANYMHIETLLQRIYHTLAMVIAKKTFGEIRQIFNLTNDFASGEGHLIGNENQILASMMESLPMELQLKIKTKVVQRFYYGEWNPWRYDVDSKTLFVELANLYDPHNMYQQIVIILLHIDMGLVNTLVLQTGGMMSFSPHPSGEVHMEWVDPMDMNLFKDLMDGIDMLKIENLVLDED